jgi:transposase
LISRPSTLAELPAVAARRFGDRIALLADGIPFAHAAVFCVDEKTAIQALDRKDPVLPLSPERAERHGFDHVIADNLSAHKTRQVAEFLERHPKVHLHFTPTYSSSLNQVELWFSKIERDVIARGVFTSLADLRENSCTSVTTTRCRRP